ncbi:MAG: trehalose-phosphatase [Candidatus Acidiferrales bacterium]
MSAAAKAGVGVGVAAHAAGSAGAASAASDLFQAWPAIARRLKAARRIALVLDFDGTLVPIAPRPEEVVLEDATRLVLQRLARHRRIYLAFLSGRRRADLMRLLQVKGAHYFGLYGWERDGRFRVRAAEKRVLEALRVELEEKLSGLPGVRVEDKEFSVATHYRGAKADVVRRLRKIMEEEGQRAGADFHTTETQCVIELLTHRVRGKGEAMKWLLGTLGKPVLPIYVGTDEVDEGAFAALGSGGISVHVGEFAATCARYRVESPRETTEFLLKIDEVVSGS